MNQETTKPNRSDAMKAALLSAVILPGVGQLFNRQWVKGAVVSILFLLASLSVLIPLTLVAANYFVAIGSGSVQEMQEPLDTIKKMWGSLVVLVVCSLILYVYSIIDAYKQRKQMDKKASSINTQ